MDQKYIVALELSGSQVRGALASVAVSPNGTAGAPTIEAISTENDTDCVQYGRVQNVINAAKATDIVLQKLQDSCPLEGGRINGAYVALGGRSLSSEKVTAEITLSSEMVITKQILKELFIEAAKKAAPNIQVLRVLPRKYTVDNQPMGNPEGVLGRKIRGEFTLVTCNPTNQRNLELMAADKERVDLAVKNYIVTPLAVADMVLNEDAKQRGCVLVDIGHHTITISIYKDRALQYLRTLPMGAHSITRDISSGMNWTLEKAEKMKCSDGDAMAQQTRATDELSRMNAYVAARAYEIVANIKANIDYSNIKPSDLPEGFVLVGRGSYLNNFDQLLSAQCKMRVHHARIPSSVRISAAIRNVHPEDYLPLIAIVLSVSHKPNFPDCLTRPKATELAKEETTFGPLEEVAERTRTTSETKRQERKPVDEDNWDEDDEEEPKTVKDPKKPKDENVQEENAATSDSGKKKKSILDRIAIIKKKFADVVTPSDIEDDTEI